MEEVDGKWQRMGKKKRRAQDAVMERKGNGSGEEEEWWRMEGEWAGEVGREAGAWIGKWREIRKGGWKRRWKGGRLGREEEGSEGNWAKRGSGSKVGKRRADFNWSASCLE